MEPKGQAGGGERLSAGDESNECGEGYSDEETLSQVGNGSLVACGCFLGGGICHGGWQQRERRCNRGKPSVILPGTAHEPHPRLVPACLPPQEIRFPPSIPARSPV